jgi:hypothetical protein
MLGKQNYVSFHQQIRISGHKPLMRGPAARFSCVSRRIVEKRIIAMQIHSVGIKLLRREASVNVAAERLSRPQW